MTDVMIDNLKDMERKFQSGAINQFTIHGNVLDYLPIGREYVALDEYLKIWLEDKMDIVAFYGIASGLEFHNPDHEAIFRKVNGLTKPEINLDDKRYKSLTPEQKRELKQKFEKEYENEPEPLLPYALGDVVACFKLMLNPADDSKNKYKVALIIKNARHIAPTSGSGTLNKDDRLNVAILEQMTESQFPENSVLILVSRSVADINDGLRGRGSRLKSVEIPLPKFEERLVFVNHLFSRSIFKRSEMDLKELAQNTGGLSLREIEEICKESENVKLEVITREKSRLLENELGEHVKIMSPRWGLDKGLGGLEYIKEYFKELKPALLRGDSRIIPPAIILMGPPGTGKTAIPEAMAYDWGVPFVEILNNRSMWYGESERITLKILSTLQALSPCVLFWDEFDQEEAPRGSMVGDSGVGNHLRKIRFQILSDPKNRGKFLVIYATNRVELLDIADKRSGRGSVRIPMLLPGRDEQVKIFKIMPGRYDFNVNSKDENRFGEVVDFLIYKHGDYISGADIEEISLAAFRRSVNQKHKSVHYEDYEFTIKHDFVPHHYASTRIRLQEEAAVRERSSNRFLSKRGWEILKRLESESSSDN